MAKFIEVKVSARGADPQLGGILRFEEKESEKPRFFDMIVSPGIAEFVAVFQDESRRNSILSGEDLTLNLLSIYGIKMKEVRITEYKKQRFFMEVLAVDKDGNEKMISSNITDAIIIGLSAGAKMMVDEQAFKKAITIAKRRAKKAIERTVQNLEEQMIEKIKRIKGIVQIPLPEKARKVQEGLPGIAPNPDPGII